jgi:hypothetical protein
VNMDRQGAHKHRGNEGMLLQYLIGPEMGQKGVIDRGAVRVFTGGDGGTAFCRLGCQKVVKEEQNCFWEMTWCCWCSWLGLRGSVAAGRRRGRAGGGTGARRRCGPAIPVEEIGIDSLGELRWVVAVLFVLWIGDGEQRWRLSTVSRSRGGGLVKCGGRSRGK